MFQQLLTLVREHAGESIVRNPAIPDEHNESAIAIAAGSILEVLKGSAGNMDSIRAFFGGEETESQVTAQVITRVQEQFVQKFNLAPDELKGIVQQLIPGVMQSLVRKTNDPSDSSFNMDDILVSIGSGNTGSALNAVKGLFGK